MRQAGPSSTATVNSSPRSMATSIRLGSACKRTRSKQPRHCMISTVGGAFEIENRHGVGERIVVNRFVILIRTDHLPDVGATVRLDLRPAHPEACRLHKDFGACFQHEGVVS